MFVILDGEAQFTIDGRTSVLKGPAGALCRMGHSHAIYNATDKPVQWMNINVSAMKGTYDNFDLGDDRRDVPIDPIPVFMTMRLDRALLRPVNGMSGGKGTVAVSACVGTVGLPQPVGLCGPPGASAKYFDRSPPASGGGRILLCNEWPGRRHGIA